MLNSSIRCCLRMQRTLEISCLSSNRLVFSPVRVNPSVRCLSLSSVLNSDSSSSDLDKLISGSDKKSEIELLFQDKAPPPSSPTEVVEVSVVTNIQNRPNTEYIWFLRNDQTPNTEYIRFLKMIEYRIPNSTIRMLLFE